MKAKQLFLTMAVFCAACAVASAQVTFGSWGRAVVTPLAFSGEHSAVSAATSTWGDVPRIGFSANGTSPNQNIGFNLDFDFGIDITNNNNIAIIGDNAKAWIKPIGLALPEQFNMFKLTAGWFKEDELRGKIGATEFGSWTLPNGSKDEDNIFTRFNATAGAHFKLDPLMWLDTPWNGLTIQGAFGSNALGASGNKLRAILNLYNNEDNTLPGKDDYENSTDNDGDRKMSALDVYKAMQIALGYRIPELGLFRLQFIGNNRAAMRWWEQGGGKYNQERKIVTGLSSNKDADVIEAAFLYDGLDGLKVDLGMKIPIAYSTTNNIEIYPQTVDKNGAIIITKKENGTNDEYNVQRAYVVALGASWTPSFLDSLNVQFRTDVSFGEKIEKEGDQKAVYGAVMAFWLIPSYSLSKVVKLGIDMALEVHSGDTFEAIGPSYDELTEATKYVDAGFGPWVELAAGGARMRVGVVVMLPGRPLYWATNNTYYDISPKFSGDPVVSIPISFTYSF